MINDPAFVNIALNKFIRFGFVLTARYLAKQHLAIGGKPPKPRVWCVNVDRRTDHDLALQGGLRGAGILLASRSSGQQNSAVGLDCRDLGLRVGGVSLAWRARDIAASSSG